MPTPFLAINCRSGTPQALRYEAAAPVVIGVTVGAADNNTGWGTVADNVQNVCNIVQFGGYQTFLTIAGGLIYRTTNAGASWASVYDMAATGGLAATTQGGHTGLRVLYVNGVPRVITQMYGGGGSWRTAFTLDGTAWTTGSSTVGFATNYAPSGVVVWRGLVYSFSGAVGGTNNATVLDPSANEVSYVSGPATVAKIGVTGATVFNNRLFMTTYGPAGNTTQVALYEISSSFVQIALLTAASTSPADDQKYGMFVDGAYMYSMFWTSVGGNQWKCIRFDANLAQTDVSAVVLPAALTGATSSSRVGVLIDQAFPGTAPTIFIYFAASGAAASPFTCYKWNGPASQMTNIDFGGSAADAMPFVHEPDGGYFWTSGERHIELVSRLRLLGAERIGFKLYSPNASVDAVSVRGWVADAFDEYPLTAAVFTTPSVGSMSGNTITGLDAADNGATAFLVNWVAPSNGFVTGDRAKLLLEIFS